MQKILSIEWSPRLTRKMSSKLSLENALLSLPRDAILSIQERVIRDAQTILNQKQFAKEQDIATRLDQLLQQNRKRIAETQLSTSYKRNLEKRSAQLEQLIENHNRKQATVLAIGGWYSGCTHPLPSNQGYSGITYIVVRKGKNIFIEMEDTSLLVHSLKRVPIAEQLFQFKNPHNDTFVYPEDSLPPLSGNNKIVPTTHTPNISTRSFRVELLKKNVTSDPDDELFTAPSDDELNLDEIKENLSDVQGISAIRLKTGTFFTSNDTHLFFLENEKNRYSSEKENPEYSIKSIRVEYDLKPEWTEDSSPRIQSLLDNLESYYECMGFLVRFVPIEPNIQLRVSGMMCDHVCPALIEELNETMEDILSINAVYNSTESTTLHLQVAPDSPITYQEIVDSFEELKSNATHEKDKFRVLEIVDAR